MHMRRCTQRPPVEMQSSQPALVLSGRDHEHEQRPAQATRAAFAGPERPHRVRFGRRAGVGILADPEGIEDPIGATQRTRSGGGPQQQPRAEGGREYRLQTRSPPRLDHRFAIAFSARGLAREF